MKLGRRSFIKVSIGILTSILIGKFLFYSVNRNYNRLNKYIAIENTINNFRKLPNRGFKYVEDSYKNFSGLEEILNRTLPENARYEVEDQEIFGIYLHLESIDKDVEILHALRDFYNLVNIFDEKPEDYNCYRYLKGEIKNYKINIKIPWYEDSSNIKPPSVLSRCKIGDCEDYALLLSCALHYQGIKPMIMLGNNHAICAVNLGKNTVYLGSSEYIINPTRTLEDVHLELKHTYEALKRDNLLITITPDNIEVTDYLLHQKIRIMKSEKETIELIGEQAKIGLEILKIQYPEVYRKIGDFDIEEAKQKRNWIVYNLINKVFKEYGKGVYNYCRKMQDILNDKKEMKVAYKTIFL